MDMKSLKYFQFVAMYRNFSRAAEHFYIGQSALSRQIANLEKELGVQLFDRDTRNVRLTGAGQVLYENCDLLVRHHELIYRLLDAAKSGYDGQLSIATVGGFGALIMAPVKAFMEAYPKVKTRLEDIPFDELSDSIVYGVYDLAFTLDFAVPNDDQISAVPVGEDHFIAVMSRDYQADLGSAVTVGELLEQPIVVPRHIGPPFLRQLRLAGQQRGVPAASGIEYVPNTNTAMLQVDLGLGITFMPKQIFACAFSEARFKCCSIKDLDTRFSMVLIRRKDNIQKTMRNFLDIVRADRGSRRSSR